MLSTHFYAFPTSTFSSCSPERWRPLTAAEDLVSFPTHSVSTLTRTVEEHAVDANLFELMKALDTEGSFFDFDLEYVYLPSAGRANALL
jgi:hypothetical protein